MREQLSKYVELLFAGTTDTDEIRQEILQNSLDKFDDLVAQGKTPEAAYRLTISGIGDINEILGQPSAAPTPSPSAKVPQPKQTELSDNNRKLLRASAIALYILSAIPTVLSDGNTAGVCLTVLLVAIATAIMVYIGKSNPETAAADSGSEFSTPEAEQTETTASSPKTPEPRSKKTARGIIWGIGTGLYICLSVITGAWYITWLIFPMLACVQGIVSAIFDLKEACKK
ncbi:MAG: hypothetical protein IJW14_04385 [Oscillospiraceae bacterium]|nr:hypothetical protein [Oscillospiraceae bacterium]